MEEDKWKSSYKASQYLDIPEALLWSLKASKRLEAGIHWLYVTGKPKSNVRWNVSSIRLWQAHETAQNDI